MRGVFVAEEDNFKAYYIDSIFDSIWQDGLDMNDESVVHTTEGEDHAAVDEDEERIRNSYLVLGCKLFFLIARPETVAQCVHGCGTVVEELRSWRSKGGPPTITSASHPIVSEVESRCMRVGGVGRTTSLASVVTRCDGSENGPKKSENT